MDQALSPEQDKVPPTPPNSPSRRRKRHHERLRSNRHGAGRSGSDYALLLPPPPGLSAEIDSPDVDGPPAVRFYPTVPGGSNGIPIGSLVAAVTGNYIVYGADQMLPASFVPVQQMQQPQQQEQQRQHQAGQKQRQNHHHHNLTVQQQYHQQIGIAPQPPPTAPSAMCGEEETITPPEYGRKLYFAPPEEFDKNRGADVVRMFRGKYVVLIGDWNMRSMYKDILMLMTQNGAMLQEKDVSVAGGERFKGGKVVKFIYEAGWHKPHLIKECRCLDLPNMRTLIEFVYTTKAYPEFYVEMLKEDLTKNKERRVRAPDFVIVGATLTELIQSGPDHQHAEAQFMNGLQQLINFYEHDLSPRGTIMLWCTSPVLPLKPGARYLIEKYSDTWPKSTWKTIKVRMHMFSLLGSDLFMTYRIPVLDLYHLSLKQPLREFLEGGKDELGAVASPLAVRHMTNCLLSIMKEIWADKSYSVARAQLRHMWKYSYLSIPPTPGCSLPLVGFPPQAMNVPCSQQLPQRKRSVSSGCGERREAMKTGGRGCPGQQVDKRASQGGVVIARSPLAVIPRAAGGISCNSPIRAHSCHKKDQADPRVDQENSFMESADGMDPPFMSNDLQALSITASEEDAEDVTIELTSDSDSDSETSSAENAKSALKRRDAGEEHNVLKQEILTVTAGNHATMEYAHAVFIEEPESESADDQDEDVIMENENSAQEAHMAMKDNSSNVQCNEEGLEEEAGEQDKADAGSTMKESLNWSFYEEQ